MLAWMERVDGLDAKGHLIVTHGHRVAHSMTRREIEELRAMTLSVVAATPKVARARLMPLRGRNVDVSREELDTYLEEPANA